MARVEETKGLDNRKRKRSAVFQNEPNVLLTWSCIGMEPSRGHQLLHLVSVLIHMLMQLPQASMTELRPHRYPIPAQQ
jgi:hypothetical protein